MDGTPDELYRRIPLHLKGHLAEGLWDIAIGRVDIPPDWANLVHPLYKKGDWANPDNWRPIVCARTEGKLIWMLILKRVAPSGLPGHPTHDVGSNTGTLSTGGHLHAGRAG